MTLFEMKVARQALVDELNTVKAFLTEKAADPTFSIEDLEKKQKDAENLQKRLATMDASIKEAEDAQKAKVVNNTGAGMTEKEAKIHAKAAFFRAALAGGDVRKAYEGLGGIPAADADLGKGDALLPKTLANDLVLEPLDVNPLRTIARVTNISGLEEPKLGFTIEDADIKDVTDKQTANEIETTGDTVVYGRIKAKVSATIKDTVLHGTDLDVVNAVENALASALAKREKFFAFQPQETATSDAGHKHMSFYATDNAIKTVEGETLYAAIVDAYADLADDFAANASIVMRKADYYGIVKDLANSSEALFGSKPASILGVPVVFCEAATDPIVGDFSYYGINYDIGAIYETDKDAKKGEYYFVLTAWGDQQIRLKSAFRIAKVSGE